MKKIFVKPRDGLLVRRTLSEGGALLDQDGELVKHTIYWRRRLKFGDVVEARPKKEPAPVKEVVEEVAETKKTKGKA